MGLSKEELAELESAPSLTPEELAELSGPGLSEGQKAAANLIPGVTAMGGYILGGGPIGGIAGAMLGAPLKQAYEVSQGAPIPSAGQAIAEVGKQGALEGLLGVVLPYVGGKVYRKAALPMAKYLLSETTRIPKEVIDVYVQNPKLFAEIIKDHPNTMDIYKYGKEIKQKFLEKATEFRQAQNNELQAALKQAGDIEVEPGPVLNALEGFKESLHPGFANEERAILQSEIDLLKRVQAGNMSEADRKALGIFKKRLADWKKNARTYLKQGGKLKQEPLSGTMESGQRTVDKSVQVDLPPKIKDRLYSYKASESATGDYPMGYGDPQQTGEVQSKWVEQFYEPPVVPVFKGKPIPGTGRPPVIPEWHGEPIGGQPEFSKVYTNPEGVVVPEGQFSLIPQAAEELSSTINKVGRVPFHIKRAIEGKVPGVEAPEGQLEFVMHPGEMPKAPDVNLDRLTLNDLYNLKQRLQDMAKYLSESNQKLTPAGDAASKGASRAASVAKEQIDTMENAVAQKISDVTKKQQELNRISGNLNKGMLSPGASDQAVADMSMGSVSSEPSEEALKSFDALTGNNIFEQLRDYGVTRVMKEPQKFVGESAARKFLVPAAMTAAAGGLSYMNPDEDALGEKSYGYGLPLGAAGVGLALTNPRLARGILGGLKELPETELLKRGSKWGLFSRPQRALGGYLWDQSFEGE
jgi:hypothetical protein